MAHADTATPAAAVALITRALLRGAIGSERVCGVLSQRLELGASETAAIVYLAAEGSQTPTRLAASLRLSSGGASAPIGRLRRADLITHHVHPTDGRSRVLELTPVTRERLLQAASPLQTELEPLIQDLLPRDRGVVQLFLVQATDIAERHTDTAASQTGRRESGVAVPWPWS